MNLQGKGCFRLFKIGGITVLVHWSWLVVAVLELSVRKNQYPTLGWNVAEYLALFGIVLLHELGHALACRQVGGQADRVVLWPMGGVAFVKPPPRPGALFWSMAGGPLVNVLLIPVTIGLVFLVRATAPPALLGSANQLCVTVTAINIILLVFNVLPIYPLDGGQMLYAMWWPIIGRARSLQMCSTLGVAGAGALFLFALNQPGDGSWLMIIAVFMGIQALAGFRQARLYSWLQPVLDHLNRAVELVRQGDHEAALAECDQAQALVPEGHRIGANVYSCRALALAGSGRHAEAVAALDEAIQLAPGEPTFHVNRGLSLAHQGYYAEAAEDYRLALHMNPDLPAALNNLAWLLATAVDDSFRNGPLAVELAQRACKLSGGKEPSYLGTLAAAHAEAGDYAAAVSWQKKALENPAYCEVHGDKAHMRLRLYEAGQPHRESVGG